jgi:hypothetical protein
MPGLQGVAAPEAGQRGGNGHLQPLPYQLYPEKLTGYTQACFLPPEGGFFVCVLFRFCSKA